MKQEAYMVWYGMKQEGYMVWHETGKLYGMVWHETGRLYGMVRLHSIKVGCICIMYKYGQSLLKGNHVKNMKLYASLCSKVTH